ncbi:phytoene desaturase family protein [Paenibacillus sp. SI8]|uniref:phytoene desaturase family protein n=1 Tax=unclassified Paenibacillus TaxID=185978 RepID=UPI0034658C3D
MTLEKKVYDTAVVGGGLTGLTAAVYLARAGKSVIVFEKESRLGGLAQTAKMNGALFNLGPHAMYEGGAALRILSELGCLPNGGYAFKGSMIGILQGKIVEVPNDLTPEESREWGALMSGIGQIDTESILSVNLRKWVDDNIFHERVRLLFLAMCRQWTYCDGMNVMSAGFAIRQGQLAGKGVRYVEGGWQIVVDSLRDAAAQAGASFVTGNGVRQIQVKNERVCGVQLSDGTEIKASAVIAATGPQELCRLLPGADRLSIGRWKEESRPLYAACLDVALKQFPYPERVFALGLDEPLYFSKHSGPVTLSDNGALVLHAMRYNDNDNLRDAQADEKALIDLMDLLEPGWEKEVVSMRFSPNVLVGYDSHTIHHNGAGPAPGPVVPEVPGLYVAGDWVGAEGRLADAGMASAKQAAEEVLRYTN